MIPGLLLLGLGGFFILIFLFLFFIKIYFRFGNLQEYTPATQLPGGRDLAARQLGGQPGRPAAGRLALPPLYKGWLVPHTSFASLKFQKLRKKNEGEKEAKPYRIFEPVTAVN